MTSASNLKHTPAPFLGSNITIFDFILGSPLTAGDNAWFKAVFLPQGEWRIFLGQVHHVRLQLQCQLHHGICGCGRGWMLTFTMEQWGSKPTIWISWKHISLDFMGYLIKSLPFRMFGLLWKWTVRTQFYVHLNKENRTMNYQWIEG